MLAEGRYLSKQLSWTNMMLVPMYWFKSMVFGRDIGNSSGGGAWGRGGFGFSTFNDRNTP